MLRVNNNLSETRFLTILLLPVKHACSLRTGWLGGPRITNNAVSKSFYTWDSGSLVGNEMMTSLPRTVCGVSDAVCEADARGVGGEWCLPWRWPTGTRATLRGV